MEPYSYLSDPDVPDFDGGPAFTVMDATCGLCARGAAWIAHRDHAQVFRIIPLQSDLGRALMRHYGLDPADPLSWLFIDDGRAATSLDACIRVARRLGGVWHAAGLLRVIPPPLGRALYGWVARNRYRFFGRTDLCAMPDPQVQARLLVGVDKDG